MSQPIYVSPSTTLVQVNPLQIPNTVVYPNSVQFTGQTFTVLDATSSILVFENPIVLSTINHKVFVDGTFSTTINQPQGFVTLQAQSTFQWGFLNSYPFRNQFISAGTQFTTLSTLNSQIINADRNILSTLFVKNLNVSGNIFISSGLSIGAGPIATPDLSTLGNFVAVSSLTVASNTFFSSFFSTVGTFFTGSSLTVKGNLFSQSSIQTGNFAIVSSSAFVSGFLSTPYIQVDDGFTGQALNVILNPDPVPIHIGGSVSADGSLKTFAALNVGGDVETKKINLIGNLTLLSSASFNQSVIVDFLTNFKSNVSTLDSVGIGGNLTVGDIFVVPQDINSSNFIVKNSFDVGTYISSQYVDTLETAVYNNFLGFSTLTRANYIDVHGNVGLQEMRANSTIVGGSFSVGSAFVSYKDSFISDGLWISSVVSTLREGKTSSWASTLGYLSTFMIGSADSLHVVSTLNIQGTLNTNLNAESTIILGYLSVDRDLTVRDVLRVSSYTLPSSLITFNLEASTINVGYLGQASSLTYLQNLNTSSLIIGSTQNQRNTVENYLPFHVNSFSTFTMSSLLLQNTYQDNLDAERRYNALRITSSFAVNTSASNNSFEVKPLGYLFSTSYAYQVISTAKIDGQSFSGSFQGDGGQLFNIMYPRNLSVGVAFISTLFTSNAFISSAVLSSGVSYASTNMFSTLQVNTMNIFGNAFSSNVPKSNVIVAYDSQRALILNNMYIQKPYLPQYPAFVSINPFNIRSGDIYSDTNQPGLEVGNTLRYTDIQGIPADSLIFNEFRAENLYIQHLGSNTFPTNLSNDMYISSGIIRASSTSFFIDQNTSYIQFSTNLIQPLFSTLVFNSTLFLERDTQRVGINHTPNATLDVQAMRLSGNVQVLSSIFIQDTLQQVVPEGTSLSNLWQQGPVSFSQDTPSFGKVQTNLTQAFTLVQTSLPTSSTYPSFMNVSSIYLSLNDVLYCDTRRNVGVNTYFDPSSSYQSTFTNSGLVRVSTTTIAVKAECSGLFYSLATI